MNSYQRGFMNKCAEYGVDPRHLIKYAGAYHEMITPTDWEGLPEDRQELYHKVPGSGLYEFRYDENTPGQFDHIDTPLAMGAENGDPNNEIPVTPENIDQYLTGRKSSREASGQLLSEPLTFVGDEPKTPPTAPAAPPSVWSRIGNHFRDNRNSYLAFGAGSAATALAAYLINRRRNKRNRNRA